MICISQKRSTAALLATNRFAAAAQTALKSLPRLETDGEWVWTEFQ